MHAAGNNAADARYQSCGRLHGDDAGGGADDVDDITGAVPGPNRVPVGVKGANRYGNARHQAKPLSPFLREVACKMIGGKVGALETNNDNVKERVYL